ncbi:hypothetical protein CAPTEDRAFT_218463 [Capitella teleta]|uniref:Uncharacterized protein n=1 Tax=Capitella teleta TaxID=283909 RepID=R7VJI3_CAPTE|nr:hypothetical protein CAPTEDRAFT_218463 [Capitella teleta]|eukprot:ELU18737.1 hypothetical protein CAPTEDRAFT_218463 [Capitella teleta]
MSITPPLPSEEPSHVDLGGLVYIAIIYAIFFAVFLFLFCYCAMAQDSGCHCPRRNPRMFQDRPEIEGINALPFSKGGGGEQEDEEDEAVAKIAQKDQLMSVMTCKADDVGDRKRVFTVNMHVRSQCHACQNQDCFDLPSKKAHRGWQIESVHAYTCSAFLPADYRDASL